MKSPSQIPPAVAADILAAPPCAAQSSPPPHPAEAAGGERQHRQRDPRGELTTRELACKVLATADADVARVGHEIEVLRAKANGFRDIARAATLLIDACDGVDIDWSDEVGLAEALDARPHGSPYAAHYGKLAALYADGHPLPESAVPMVAA